MRRDEHVIVDAIHLCEIRGGEGEMWGGIIIHLWEGV